MNETQRLLGVSLLGFDLRTRNVLGLFFNGPCAKHCKLVDHSEADVTVIDLDSYRGRDLKSKHDSLYPGRPTILVSINNKEADNKLLLHKPMNPTAFMAALEHVREQLQQEQQRTIEKQQKSLPPSRPTSLPSATVARSESTARVIGAPEQRTEAPLSEPDNAPTKPVAKPGPGGVGNNGSRTSSAAANMADSSLAMYVGSTQDFDPNDPVQHGKAHYKVSLYLLGYLLQACDQARQTGLPIKLTGIWHTIIVDPGNRTATTVLCDSQLRSLCMVPVKAAEVRIETCTQPKAFLADTQSMYQHREESLDAFLWRVALWTSRGRVPEETDLQRQVFLKHWPDMTRLVLPPHALRIAALWVRQPYSLMRTAQILDVPQRFVFAFYSAAWTLKLANQGQRQADQVMESPTPKHPANTGVLHRLLSRLRGRRTKAKTTTA